MKRTFTSLILLLVIIILPATSKAQTVKMLKDIWPGPTECYPNVIAKLNNNTVIFSANDSAHGQELWKTDGTPAGTMLLKDIQPGTSGSNPEHLTVSNGIAYFSAWDSLSGTELWKTDGTPGGTVIVKDIYSGVNNAYPRYFAAFGNKVVFQANTNASGYELWISDGTTNGTYEVMDIRPGYLSSGPLSFVEYKNEVYFAAGSLNEGEELWKSDGTANGTVLVKDIAPGSTPSAPRPVMVYNNELYFTAVGAEGRELWKTDGTTNGTVLVKDIYPGPSPKSGDPIALTVMNGNLYFFAHDGVSGRELWKTDGTTNGTVLVKDIEPGIVSSIATTRMIAYNGAVYFAAYTSGLDKELWKSDGTATGTVLVKDVNPTGNAVPLPCMIADNKLFFTARTDATGTELWSTDGTPQGTLMIDDIWKGVGHADPSIPELLGNKLVFFADDSVHGAELMYICLGISTAITVDSATKKMTAAATGVTYQWIDCSTMQPIAGATSQSYIPPSAGSYAVILSSNDCVDTSECISVTTGIARLGNLQGVTLYPNPTSGISTIDLGGKHNRVGITVTDIAGRRIEHIDRANQDLIELNSTNWQPGVYFVNVRTGDTTLILKMVKTF